MEVKVCKNCRRLFKYIYGPELCPECSKLMTQEKEEQSGAKDPVVRNEALLPENEGAQNIPLPKPSISPVRSAVKDEEAKFEQVRDYIMANPRASVAQISEVNDITPMKLFEWIKDDRLEFSEDSVYAWFTCEKCGAKIKSGRLCNRCKTK